MTGLLEIHFSCELLNIQFLVYCKHQNIQCVIHINSRFHGNQSINYKLVVKSKDYFIVIDVLYIISDQ